MVMYKRRDEWVDAVQFVPGMEDGFLGLPKDNKPYVFNVYGDVYEALNFGYGCWLIKGQYKGEDGWVDWYTDEEFNSLYEEDYRY